MTSPVTNLVKTFALIALGVAIAARVSTSPTSTTRQAPPLWDSC